MSDRPRLELPPNAQAERCTRFAFPRAHPRALLIGALALAGSACGQGGASPSPVPSALSPLAPSQDQASSRAPASGRWTFTDVAAASGLNFEHFIGATGQYYNAEIMGAGCALLDYDNDGDLDVLMIQGSVLEPGKTYKDAIFPYHGPVPPRTQLFRNELISKGGRGGQLRFTDVTEQAGVASRGYGMGAATGDYDNDGDLDIYISYFGPDVLLRNNGDGTFRDVTAAAGLGDPRWNTSATFLDYDNDGWLDLFVLGYNDFTVSTFKRCFTNSGARDYCGPKAFPAIPAKLYHNLRNGRFKDVTAESGIDAAYGHGLGVAAGDFDKNGWQDIYVANDSDANNLWMNRGGTLTDDALLAGAAFNEHGVPQAGMGIGIGDFDEDGDPDLFDTNLTGETNTLWRNRGDGTFEDATVEQQLGQPSVRFNGFGVQWFDADNDGDLDLFIANGDVRIVESERGKPFPYNQTNQIMIREGGIYVDRSADFGPALAISESTRGAAFGDVDNDGDIDILLSNDNAPVRLLRNDLPDSQSWIELRVLDGALRRDAIGAAVRLTLSSGRILTRWVRTDGSYLSASDPRVHLAWPKDQQMKSLDLVLADGRTLPLRNVPLNSISTVTIGPGPVTTIGR